MKKEKVMRADTGCQKIFIREDFAERAQCIFSQEHKILQLYKELFPTFKMITVKYIPAEY